MCRALPRLRKPRFRPAKVIMAATVATGLLLASCSQGDVRETRLESILSDERAVKDTLNRLSPEERELFVGWFAVQGNRRQWDGRNPGGGDPVTVGDVIEARRKENSKAAVGQAGVKAQLATCDADPNDPSCMVSSTPDRN